jgi:hypothetical protein
MTHEIQIGVGEHWMKFAETNLRAHAEMIEEMLLAKGHTTRINEISQAVALGQVKIPQKKN